VFKMFLKIREPLWNKLSRFTPTDPKRDERMIFFHGPGLGGADLVDRAAE